MDKIFLKAIILVLVFLLAACAPSASQIQTAIAQTQAAWTPTPTYAPTPTNTPIPTPTLMPLSELNLEDILIEPGDLPVGFSGAQILDSIYGRYEPQWKLKPVKVTTQTFEVKGEDGGFVTVFLFDNDQDIENAFTVISNEVSYPTKVTDIGSKGVFGTFVSAFSSIPSQTGVAFIECNAVVYIIFQNMSDTDAARAYAQRLDKRPIERVCR